ncbi:MAG: ATP-dependent Clp protease adaptor ClpS [Fimbriimonadales bacterium]
MPVIKTEPTERQQDSSYSGRYAAIMFNNDSNSFDEVIRIVMLATSCPVEEAQIETWEAHTFGEAAVHFAAETECARVALTIASIGVRTEVRKEWDD